MQERAADDSQSDRRPPLLLMPRSDKRKSRRRQLQASHQKNWLIGKYPVLEVLRAARWMPAELYMADTCEPEIADEVTRTASRTGIATSVVTDDRMQQLCHSEHHQGVAARMSPYPYQSLSELLDMQTRADVQTAPIIVVCDRIQDTFNLGAILRCCDAMAVAGVVIGEAEQVGITPQVARSSAGAVNHIPVVRAESLVGACRQLSDAAFSIAAASEKADAAAWDQPLTSATSLIVGSEAQGVSDDLLAVCDRKLRIPMMGRVGSLNAAVAAGLLLYEIRRQQCKAT